MARSPGQGATLVCSKKTTTGATMNFCGKLTRLGDVLYRSVALQFPKLIIINSHPESGGDFPTQARSEVWWFVSGDAVGAHGVRSIAFYRAHSRTFRARAREAGGALRRSEKEKGPGLRWGGDPGRARTQGSLSAHRVCAGSVKFSQTPVAGRAPSSSRTRGTPSSKPAVHWLRAASPAG
jgi:hypothetical protein